MKLLNRCAPIIAIVILAITILAACDAPESRVVTVVTYSPGAAFKTNFNHDDPRRQVRCAIVFEVIDEAAVEELDTHNYRIRNAVLSVLSEYTMDELTIYRDLTAIGERIVERVNAEVDARIYGDEFNLVIRAYFTEFEVI